MQLVLEAIVDRLIEKVDEWTLSTCFFSDAPGVGPAPPGDLFCTVSPGESVFSDLFAGGGIETLHERGSVVVSVFSRLQLDGDGRAQARWFDARRGLLSRYKPRVLKALLVDWEPQSAGQRLLRDPLYPVASSAPERMTDGDVSFVRLSLTFGMSFDWTL
ncbi:hypothetical protein [Lignipirellula cremea]|uniref:Uncharacterized protein n=1 Tax=Lignipirellula cremea TaxID=2528010 RepID=A0A518E0B1_9BACT|nr:hypothetical protein [Lignipirellula cremea]QDU97536.1 hypothetical protein Pla8534_53840 [Lignipirellula cremea]